MKKLLLALFLIFSFASNADANTPGFIITDESGKVESDVVQGLKLDISDAGVRRYKIKVTNLLPNTTIMFKNNSTRNIILRFNAGVKSQSQIVYQVGSQNNFSTSDYYALSSCEVDKSTNNRPTRSFLIINGGQTKFLRFSLRNCETGEINDKDPLDLETTLSVLGTNMIDTSVDHTEPNTLGLPTVIIGQDTVRDLSTKSATGEEKFLCRTSNNIKSLELYDGSGKKIESFAYKYLRGSGERINFTIKNEKGINYRKMHFKITCNSKLTGQIVQRYYFDARPKEIQVSNLPSEGEWLYAEQKYKSDDGSVYNDGFNDFIKFKAGQKFLIVKRGEEVSLDEKCENCKKVIANRLPESKTMKTITLTPVDAKGNKIEDYNSISEIAIVGKIYGDGTNALRGISDANIINETSGKTLIRPCVAGSRANCEIALAEINGDKSEIFTAIDITNNKKVLAYNNVGPTVLYGADTEWTKYSQTYKAEYSGSTSSQVSTLCNKFESHSNERVVPINGKNHLLVGCNIPFVAKDGSKDGSDGINFYTFKPAVYKSLFESKNSPANDSYGTNKLTYIHTIKAEDYDATKNEIFEAADFNASILAIGASLASLKNNRALSHYDNHLKVAEKLKFSGNPSNPTITIEGTSKPNNIATDFRVTASNSKTDISGAIMLTLEPKNPYNHKEGYKANPKLEEITTDRDNITINMLSDNFYAGKNIKVNKLNFNREDLLARSYAHIGKSSLDIDITKNTDLNTKITNDQAAFVFDYRSDDLNFVDAAIIAPNVASNETSADGAVYLAGFCDPESHADCRESGIFISDTIAGHINYFGFKFLAYGKRDTDIEESTTDSLFDYDGADFAQFRRGADFLNSFNADEVKIELKGDKAREYCNIFRNCYPLGTGFGTTFNSYKARATQWHGGGEQGTNIVDGTARRKEQRLNF
ncbi:hypothetical protein [Campylobacter sp.]|uniref:hypothetical protein n=1 Tax=Campylobacter sp. TaxID=205 RepID=UPI002AA8B196|nr:hypothetical protein [Campylobacter sp.]MCI7075772.1 hypothetical protein [Campylobacter sp.]